MINLIWQTSKGVETTDHYEYVTKVIFKNVEFTNYLDNKEYKTILPNSIIIYSCLGSEITNELRIYLQKYKTLNVKYSLLHLSNENLNHNHGYYSDAEHVFRPYYDPTIRNDNVTTIPLGFVSGYMNNEGVINLSDKRDTLVTFIGQVKSDRQILVDSISDIDNKFMYLTKQWNCPTALSPKEVIDIYKKTLFIPCPKGWINPDSLRIFEALEWGCIPIIKRYGGVDYFENIFGKHPIPVVNEWTEIKPLMEKLNDENIDNLITSINKWYKTFMNSISENINNIINKKMIMINKKMTVLIPFRNREDNLKVFIPYFRNFMKNNFSDINYEIIIIEQGNDKLFNKGILFYVGYLLTSGNTDYYALHDVDQLPISADYSYNIEPCHLFVNAFDQKKDGTLVNSYLLEKYQQKGGVITVTKELYELANGHSNMYWGWGLIDDDFSFRLFDIGHHLLRYGVRMNHGHLENNDKGYYVTLCAKTDRFYDDDNYKRNYNYALGVVRRQTNWKLEGLNTTKFNIIDTVITDEYTKYIIDFENDVNK